MNTSLAREEAEAVIIICFFLFALFAQRRQRAKFMARTLIFFAVCRAAATALPVLSFVTSADADADAQPAQCMSKSLGEA